MIKAILFDLDDTLLWDKKSVKESFRATCLEAEERTGINHHTFEKTVREKARELYSSYDVFPFTKKIGINPFEGLWGDFTDEINIGFRRMHAVIYDYQKNSWTNALEHHGVYDQELGKSLASRFRYHRRRLPFLYEDTFDVLAKLKENYQLLLLTNGAPSLQHEKLKMTPQLVPYFHYIVISGAFGIGKPDTSIFEHSLRLLDVNKEEAIMIGDNLKTDILGSNRTGIKNIWINRDDQNPQTDISYTKQASSLTGVLDLLSNF
ncbi:HAD family hydrolase [Bacillus piscicola]|uniref:HAD family hydrolase n=1 Tax=Bacillus piscicola TaxID=1632684 RepID=UPI001F09A2E3|nr:HAD family hydrolase [Bacillus piscicola]